MLITGKPILDRDGAIKLVAVIEREITDLDAMLVELEATKDKIRSVEAADRRHRRQNPQALRTAADGGWKSQRHRHRARLLPFH